MISCNFRSDMGCTAQKTTHVIRSTRIVSDGTIRENMPKSSKQRKGQDSARMVWKHDAYVDG